MLEDHRYAISKRLSLLLLLTGLTHSIWTRNNGLELKQIYETDKILIKIVRFLQIFILVFSSFAYLNS